ncbi:anti-sigma U factor RsuA [Streptomyces malaysiensis subsp. malaysiensis]|uniref:Zf-HC2 domain-containing protein n=1 Tax=Streptomyces malaysiensis TaxID=92644 RepID=A0ABX6WA80_STRMQ|nr:MULTISPECIES: zf-HC2 domain-containing protein [Streptomyces]QPI56741.1 zf-HC2 domain-containing protein [Streptomyces solisilvae]UHH18255.1 zf-HC2 domain-containing protein [Streptomyces sp. HNM0561]
MMPAADDQQHTAVGAYALGVLDPADAARFEDHLIGCERCAAELDELMGLPPLLAEYATAADGTALPDPAVVTARPGPELLDRLLDDVSSSRKASGRRRLFLVAAAAVLIVGGPLAGAAITKGSDDGDGKTQVVASTSKQVFDQGRKFSAVDPVTKVDASVSLQQKGWGTSVALKLGNLKGPRSCDLVAIGKDGHEETITTWAVPTSGYGVKDGDGSRWSKEPLYAQGGAAMNTDEIERFEVRTLDGQRLAEVRL